MATPEGKVKDAIKRYLKGRGDTWFYMPVQNGMGVAGIPDIMACVAGRLVGIECKAPGKLGTVTALQRQQLDGIAKAGGIAILADRVEIVIITLKVNGL